MSTPHNSAAPGQIAKTVLMPGDPLRSKFIAEHFLDNPVLVNNVRCVQGYTGSYHGVPVSVMASGMGMPSIGIYSWELFKFYDVDNIIRVGSAGAYTADLNLFDVFLADAAYSESTYALVQGGNTAHTLYPSAALNTKLEKAAAKLGIELHEGTTHSSDVFYRANDGYLQDVILNHHCKVVEMESFALFANAAVLHKNAATILTVSDSFVTHQETTPQEREESFTRMMQVALEAAADQSL